MQKTPTVSEFFARHLYCYLFMCFLHYFDTMHIFCCRRAFVNGQGSADGKLTEDSLMEVMREQKANQQEQLKIPVDKVRAIIKKDMPPKELEDFILKAVTDYQRKLIRQAKDHDAR